MFRKSAIGIFRTGDASSGIECNEPKALELLLWAAEQSILPTHQWLNEISLEIANWCYKGWCTPKDWSRSLKWFSITSNQPNGNGESERKIGEMYDTGKLYHLLSLPSVFDLIYLDMVTGGYGIEKNEKMSFEWMSRGAELGDAIAQYNVAVMYRYGNKPVGVIKNESLSYKWMLQSARQNHAAAQYKVGTFYRDEIGTPRNQNKAIEWWMRASDNKDCDGKADTALGLFYSQGKHDEVAFRYYLKGAQRGDTNAQVNVSLCYQHGMGVIKDEKLALKWLLQAGENGHVESQDRLGQWYSNGICCELDDRAALRWWCLAAKNGSSDAMTSIAYLYSTATDLSSAASPPKDDQAAFAWYLKAAQMGNVNAQYNVGICYQAGIGVIRDTKKAFEWFMKAASQKDPRAYYYVALCHRDKIGTKRDEIECVKWLIKASEGGELEATNLLTKMVASTRS
jgi:TPR repeat protein